MGCRVVNALLGAVLLAAGGCGGETYRHEEVLRGTLGAMGELTEALAALRGPAPSDEALRRLDEAIDGLAGWLAHAPHLHPLPAEEEAGLQSRYEGELKRVRESYAAERDRILADEALEEVVRERLDRLRRLL